MKKRIEQLADGRFEFDVPDLILSQERIEYTTKQSVDVEGELHIGTSNNSAVRGQAMSTHRRMILGKDRFSGNAIHIPYKFDVQGMSPGSSFSGSLILSTHIGEYQIPFTVTIEDALVRSPSGNSYNLDDFAELAGRDIREAFLLYTSSKFPVILRGEPKEYRVLYDALSKNPVTYQHLEEFLIATGKKEPVHLSLEDTGRSFFEVPSSSKNILTIHRNTWGYVKAEVEIVGEFIEVEKHSINADDFIGTVYGFEYVIRADKLGHGKKFGKIIIRSCYETLVFDITASLSIKNYVSLHMRDKKNAIRLTSDYLCLMLHKIDFNTWYTRTKALLEEMRNDGSFYAVHRLYEAYLYYSSDKNDIAVDILREFSRREFAQDEIELAGFYLYLCKVTDVLPPGEINVTKRLREMYEQHDSMALLWVLLQVDEELSYAPTKKMYMMETQFEKGCTSPYLYIEALKMVNQDVTFMRNITPFWMQVLYFAGRLRVFTEELALRVAYLAGYEKSFNEGIFRILEKIYEQLPLDAVLEAICQMLLRGEPMNNKYFPWYEKAVERDIRVTRLYEYYVETMKEDYHKMLPQSIRLYFSYNNTLDDSKKAFIYANIIANKDDDDQTYNIYRDAMKSFAFRMLKNGEFNYNYAVIYREFVQLVRERSVGESLSKVLFLRKLTINPSNGTKIRDVIVHHDPLRDEIVCPCTDGVAYVPVYSANAKIVFQDEDSCRYYSTVDYTLETLMYEEDLVGQCLGIDVRDPGFLLHVCTDSPSADNINIVNVCAFQNALEAPEFCERYKDEIRQRLLEYYTAHAGDDTLDEYLHEIDYESFSRNNKKLLVEALIERSWFDDAFEVINKFGYEDISVGALLKLCSRLIEIREYPQDEELLYLAEYVFNEGKYDTTLLSYLVKYHVGTIEGMYKIWDCAERFDMDAFDLEERLLIFSMYVRSYPPHYGEVLKHFVEQGGSDQIVEAYLSFLSYSFFFETMDEDETAIKYIEDMCADPEHKTNQICRLALVRHYVSRPDIVESHRDIIERIMAQFAQEGLRLSIFQQLPRDYLLPFQMDDRIFVEQKAAPRDKVTLHYSIHSGQAGDEELEYTQEPLKNIFQGIFSREFILFYGENLTYYFTVEHDGQVIETSKKQVSMRQVAMQGSTRYQLINQMLANRRLGKEKPFSEVMDRYLFLEQMARSKFNIMQ